MLQYCLTWLRAKGWMPELKREEGQDLAEYALLLALIAVLLTGALWALKEEIGTVFDNIVSALQTTTKPT